MFHSQFRSLGDSPPSIKGLYAIEHGRSATMVTQLMRYVLESASIYRLSHIRTLIAANPEVLSERNSCGGTALHVAAANYGLSANTEVLDILSLAMSSAQCLIADSRGNTALDKLMQLHLLRHRSHHYGIGSSAMKLLKTVDIIKGMRLLLARGCKFHGKTNIVYYIEKCVEIEEQQIPMIQLLLELYPRVLSLYSANNAILIRAIATHTSTRVELVQLLLSKGCKPTNTIMDVTLESPLIESEISIGRLIVYQKETPLAVALGQKIHCGRGNNHNCNRRIGHSHALEAHDIVKMLLDAGANPFEVVDTGSVLVMYDGANALAVAKLLVEAAQRWYRERTAGAADLNRVIQCWIQNRLLAGEPIFGRLLCKQKCDLFHYYLSFDPDRQFVFSPEVVRHALRHYRPDLIALVMDRVKSLNDATDMVDIILKNNLPDALGLLERLLSLGIRATPEDKRTWLGLAVNMKPLLPAIISFLIDIGAPVHNGRTCPALRDLAINMSPLDSTRMQAISIIYSALMLDYDMISARQLAPQRVNIAPANNPDESDESDDESDEFDYISDESDESDDDSDDY